MESVNVLSQYFSQSDVSQAILTMIIIIMIIIILIIIIIIIKNRSWREK